MNAEQRAETFESFKAVVNETDAQRRDRGWALAMERGEVIAETVQALRNMARDAELIAAAFPANSPTSDALLKIAEVARNTIKRGEKS